MQSNNTNTIKVGNKRDWRAFKQLIRRSPLGYKEPGVLAIERIANEEETIDCEAHWEEIDGYEHHWHDCDNPARVRIVRQREEAREGLDGNTIPAKRYSDTFCVGCIERALSYWLDDRLEAIAESFDEGSA